MVGSDSRPTAAAQLQGPKSKNFLRIFPPSGLRNSHAQKLTCEPKGPKCSISDVTSAIPSLFLSLRTFESPPTDVPHLLQQRGPICLPARTVHQKTGFRPDPRPCLVQKELGTSPIILLSFAVLVVLLS